MKVTNATLFMGAIIYSRASIFRTGLIIREALPPHQPGLVHTGPCSCHILLPTLEGKDHERDEVLVVAARALTT